MSRPAHHSISSRLARGEKGGSDAPLPCPLGRLRVRRALVCSPAALAARHPLVRPSRLPGSGRDNSGMRVALVYPPQAGLLHTANFSLAALIQIAYDVAVDQVKWAAQDWVRTLRFDVMAKTPNGQPAVLQGPNWVRPERNVASSVARVLPAGRALQKPDHS